MKAEEVSLNPSKDGRRLAAFDPCRRLELCNLGLSPSLTNCGRKNSGFAWRSWRPNGKHPWFAADHFDGLRLADWLFAQQRKKR